MFWFLKQLQGPKAYQAQEDNGERLALRVEDQKKILK